MSFQAKQRTNWDGAIACFVVSGLLLAVSAGAVLAGLWVGTSSQRPEVYPGVGILCGVVAVFLLARGFGRARDCRHPRLLTADAIAIRVYRGAKLIAQIPFANVAEITLLREKNYKTAAALGGLAGVALQAAAEGNVGRDVRGICVRLNALGDDHTWYPAGWFKPTYLEVYLAWETEPPFERVVAELRERHAAFFKTYRPLPAQPVDDGKDPFDFS